MTVVAVIIIIILIIIIIDISYVCDRKTHKKTTTCNCIQLHATSYNTKLIYMKVYQRAQKPSEEVE